MSKKPAVQTEDKYVLRLPDGMRDRIREAAEANNRSMNAEMVDRLTKSLEGAYLDASEATRIDARFDELAEFVVSLGDALKEAARREGELQGKVIALVDALQDSNARTERLISQLEKAGHVSS
ncbi:MAG: Arc family DNA-binding protein [Alphaproteobacteria bacterium]|nr:Arc family DNA-binding protein [Alphaproteobacteria bacterium]MBU1552336.1 Arc family DNA-binding protein [Alphaproteobacteria bacterium]MBU2334529.1 Arc family DNA-binding protein [Alphaproteobacteria bacterium]MBU2388339.1 Arc family DNA-binding protein [Alphaproteobacteria bacterium]|tara:strand:- start:294 stop:662 length:369 start_codon:yes stop_codon:yes gene_type:complete